MEPNTETAVSSTSESISSTSTLQKSTMVSSSGRTSRKVTSMSSLAIPNDNMLSKLAIGKMETPTDISKLLSNDVRKSLLQYDDQLPMAIPSSSVASSSILAKTSKEMKKCSTVMAKSGIAITSSAISTETAKNQLITADSITETSSTILESSESTERAVMQILASMEVEKAKDCS